MSDQPTMYRDVLRLIQEAKKPWQLVLHYKDVSEKAKTKMLWPARAERKYDGVFCAVVRGYGEGELAFISRTGKEFFLRAEDFGQGIAVELHELPAGIYICELVNPAMSLETLSGLVNPNRTSGWSDAEYAQMVSHAQLVAHDYLPLMDYYAGAFGTFRERHAELDLRWPLPCAVGVKVENYEEFEAFAEAEIAAGGEGAVLKQYHERYEPGHKGYKATKLVRGVSVDLQCTGFVMGTSGTKREGMVAKLKFAYKGGEVEADLGAGWTDLKRKELTGKLLNMQCADYVHFGIFTVTALQESSTGESLRLPKVGEERHDKLEPDA